MRHLLALSILLPARAAVAVGLAVLDTAALLLELRRRDRSGVSYDFEDTFRGVFGGQS